jgi:hypothetical protein
MFRRFRISCPVYRSRRPLAWRPATTTRRFAATTTGWFTATTTGWFTATTTGRFAAAAIRWSATTATGRFATTATGRFAAAAIGWLTTIRRRWWAVGRRRWLARAITSRVIALITPAVGVTPMSPWTDTQENAVIEITRSVKTIGGAGVRCIGVVAISANGRRAADSNGNLGSSRR